MGIIGKNQKNLQRIVLSGDAFTTAYTCMLLLFFVPYCAKHCGALVMGFMPLVCLVPFAVMPLCYCFIHRFNPLLFGRYHLFMPLSALCSALFFVMTFSGGEPNASSACLVFFGALVFTLLMTVYRYCAFSVRARLGGEVLRRASRPSLVFSALGAAAAIVTVYGMYVYDESTAFINASYVVGAACVILALAQYFVTVSEVPKLGGKRVQSIKSVYRTLFSDIDKRLYFSSLFFISAFIVAAGMSVFYSLALGLSFGAAVSCAAALVGAYAVCYAFAEMKVSRRSHALSIALLSLFAVSSVLFGVAAVVSGGGEVACISIASALCGAGGAFAERQRELRFLSIKPRVTSGAMFILSALTKYAAVAVALVAIVVTVSVYTAISRPAAIAYGFGLSGIFAIVGFVCARRSSVRSDKIPDLSYELREHTHERDEASAQAVE